MAAFLRKYGTGTGADVYIPIIKRSAVDFAVSADWTPAAGDVKVSKDGGAAANINTLPTAVTMGNTAMWKFVFSDSELSCKYLAVTVADAATKAVEDQFFAVETYGNASAMYQADLSAANLPANVVQLNGSATPVTNMNTVFNTDFAANYNTTSDAWVSGPLTTQAKADVNAEVDTALSDIHLDHLLAADYDPASKPGAATALLNEIVESDGGVSRFTANALEQAPTGGGTPQTGDAYAYLVSNLGTAGASATEAGGDGDHLTGIPDMATATNQTTIAGYLDTEIGAIITHLTDIKGTGFAKDTHSLTDILADVTGLNGAAMRGTDGANTTTPPTSAAIASQVRTELTTELGRIDVAVSTRLATASYVSPLDAAGVRSAVGLAAANLDTQLGDIPTVAELNARTLPAASYATEANVLLVLADTAELQTDWADGGRLYTLLDTAAAGGGGLTAQQVRDAMKLAPSVGSPAAGSIDKHLDDMPADVDTTLTASHGSGSWASGSTGSGARTITIAVDDGTNPIQNAKVRLTEGVTTYTGLTDASGDITFNVDDATYAVAITKSGYTFAGESLVVTASASQTYSMTATVISPSSPGQVTGYCYTYDEDGVIESGVSINLILHKAPSSTGSMFDGATRTVTSDANGLAEFTGMFTGAVYKLSRGTSTKHLKVTCADDGDGTMALPDFVGDDA